MTNHCRECGSMIDVTCPKCGTYDVRDSDEPHEYYCLSCCDIFYWERKRKK